MDTQTLQADSRILVTGASGMLGTALVSELRSRGFEDVLTPSHSELELMDEHAVLRYIEDTRPDYVIMAAAKVGGIAANMAQPVQFLLDNVKIQNSLFEATATVGIRGNVFIGSSCAYPRMATQPIREEALLTGPLEPTNEQYAVAKIAGIKLAEAYRRQCNIRTICPMFCNLYGPGDHYDELRSHVIPALIMRFVDAVDQHLPTITLWGTGTARREFMHVRDAARAILHLLETSTDGLINVGQGTDVTIRELADQIAHHVRFEGEIIWDSSRPEGMPRKCLDTTRLRSTGFASEISLSDGLRQCIDEYRTSTSNKDAVIII